MIRISEREKRYIYFGGGFICLFLIFQIVVYPLIDKKTLLEKQLTGKTLILKQIKKLKSEYQALQEKTKISIDNFKQRGENFTLFSFLDQLAGSVEIKRNIAYMKPSTVKHSSGQYKISTVEMKVIGISTKKLVSYLYAVETSPNSVNIKRLSIVKGNDGNSLDVVMEIETYDL